MCKNRNYFVGVCVTGGRNPYNLATIDRTLLSHNVSYQPAREIVLPLNTPITSANSGNTCFRPFFALTPNIMFINFCRTNYLLCCIPYKSYIYSRCARVKSRLWYLTNQCLRKSLIAVQALNGSE